MPHILKNDNLEVHIDLPLENYNFSRFDWTGKITTILFHGKPVTVNESLDCDNEDIFGKGLYNEFGIDSPLGFDETEVGGWFHKIGVGLLKKDDRPYVQCNAYEVKPAEFEVYTEANQLFITCTSEVHNGYSYFLEKRIELKDDTFVIHYSLKNTGSKEICTSEYTHNFVAINNELMGSDHFLKFPFLIMPTLFGETVNPEQKVIIGQKKLAFQSTPHKVFFFSNLSGGKAVDAKWKLTNTKNKIALSESGNFKTSKVNIWGTKHVISPELFIDLAIAPGESTEWSRTYSLKNI